MSAPISRWFFNGRIFKTVTQAIILVPKHFVGEFLIGFISDYE